MEFFYEFADKQSSFTVPDGYRGNLHTCVEKKYLPVSIEELTDFEAMIPENFSEKEKEAVRKQLDRCIIKASDSVIFCLILFRQGESWRTFPFRVIELICDYTQVMSSETSVNMKIFIPYVIMVRDDGESE